MSDVTLVWDPVNLCADWVITGSLLEVGGDLASATLLSLFCDRVAQPGDVIPDGTQNRRGWWGDAGESVPIGSRIWLLARAKQTDQTLARARDYIIEALQWLITDGVAIKIDTYTEWTRPGMLGAQVVIYRTNGQQVALQFTSVWQGVS
jgi:phage gp46-like protein